MHWLAVVTGVSTAVLASLEDVSQVGLVLDSHWMWLGLGGSDGDRVQYGYVSFSPGCSWLARACNGQVSTPQIRVLLRVITHVVDHIT